MTSRQTGRTQTCSDEDARNRLRHAHKFADVAALTASEVDSVEYASVAASVAVLAGIAASDAACCKALGMRARGQDHREAAVLLAKVEPGGKKAAASLGRLLSLKDEAHYGLFDIGGSDLRAALRQAVILLEFAETIVAR
jgi:hypothetical protein